MGEIPFEEPAAVSSTEANPIKEISFEEQVGRVTAILEQELQGIISTEEITNRIHRLKEHLSVVDQAMFNNVYYENFSQEWDGVTAAFVYEPKRDFGREDTSRVYILRNGMEVTPEAIQIVAHEGTHFCGLPTQISRLEPWEIEKVIPDEYYFVSTTKLTSSVGAVTTTEKDTFIAECEEMDIPETIKSGAASRNWELIDANVDLDEVSIEQELWEALTDWFALTITNQLEPGYKPKTGYVGRKVTQIYYEKANQLGLGQQFKQSIKEGLFLGDNSKLKSVLTEMEGSYDTFRSAVVGNGVKHSEDN